MGAAAVGMGKRVTAACDGEHHPCQRTDLVESQMLATSRLVAPGTAAGSACAHLFR